MTAQKSALVWFRQDLRLADNPALARASETGLPVIAIFVLDDDAAGAWAHGGASRWWLEGSLSALRGALTEQGVVLILRQGSAEAIVPELASEIGAATVFWNRCYEPWRIARDTRIKTALRERGIAVDSGNSALLHEPWVLKTKSGDPFKVFTPFWKALQALESPPRPLPAPTQMQGLDASIPSDDLKSWGLRPARPDWAKGLRDTWQPGEAAAREHLSCFLDEGLRSYASHRDFPGIPSTSRLSPHLHFGEIGPRQIWHATLHHLEANPDAQKSGWKFLSELAWREFSHHLLFHWPSLPETTWRENFRAFPWHDNEDGFLAWTRGATGYPIVDAGMRELYATGWMHNRVRMIVGSFLVKDLLVPWQQGEAWFWDTLVDADLANNAASWQWVAGCGADAAPYFRVFNPITQGEKFDPEGDYVRTWVPELAKLPNEFLHHPWDASEGTLRAAGVQLGVNYPKPIVDHGAARKRALAAFEEIKKGAA